MRAVWHRSVRLLVGNILLLGILYPFVETASAKVLYSYTDEQGTYVVTDQYDRIPSQYRSRVTTIRQDEDLPERPGAFSRVIGKRVSGVVHLIGKTAIEIPGFSPHQSQVLTYAGILGLICIVAANLSRSQVVRFLSLWLLIMIGIATPVLLYVSQDGPASIMRSKASQIQDKQLERFKSAQ